MPTPRKTTKPKRDLVESIMPLYIASLYMHLFTVALAYKRATEKNEVDLYAMILRAITILLFVGNKEILK